LSVPDPTPDPERTSRARPGTGKGIGKLPELWTVPRLHLVAPNVANTHNTIRLAGWAEVRVLTSGGKPVAHEHVSLFRADGIIVDGVTDDDGVVRFEDLSVLPPENGSMDDVQRPAVVLPDVMEEWVVAPAEPAGKFGKNKGERDDYRKRDGAVHFLTGLFSRTELTLNTLTDEQKLQHFIHAYTDNGAVYNTAKPNVFADKNHRWEWGRGSVCNQHVNFFLGYWFNYNEKFTTAGSATAMVCLPVYDSDRHLFKGGIRHRGYADFVEPVTGFGAAFGGSVYDPDTIPAPEHYERAASHVEYIRMARYFDRDSGEANDDGKRLLDSLGPVNVYSLSDIKSDKRPDAEKAIRDWLRKHKADNGLTDAQIAAKTATQLWDTVYDLDDSVDADAALIHTLKNFIVIDHHAGLLLLRAPGGGPLTSSTTARELWTFSADGAKTPGPKIELKRFADSDLGRRFLHLAIWKLKPLRPGGFAPADAEDNAGEVNIENPPRFIKWG
jgi:hypothetical protein